MGCCWASFKFSVMITLMRGGICFLYHFCDVCTMHSQWQSHPAKHSLGLHANTVYGEKNQVVQVLYIKRPDLAANCQSDQKEEMLHCSCSMASTLFSIRGHFIIYLYAFKCHMTTNWVLFTYHRNLLQLGILLL